MDNSIVLPPVDLYREQQFDAIVVVIAEGASRIMSIYCHGGQVPEIMKKVMSEGHEAFVYRRES